MIDATDALREAIKATKTQPERDKARETQAALVPQAPGVIAKFEAFAKRARAVPRSKEIEALLRDIDVDDVLLKGVPSDLEDVGRELWKTQEELEQDAARDKQRAEIEAAKAKLEQLKKDRDEELRIKGAKDAAKAKK